MTKEFALSTELPSAVTETKLDLARKRWQARSDAAAELVTLPVKPFRIRGDSDAEKWLVEEARITRSSQPYHYDLMWSRMMAVSYDVRTGMFVRSEPSDTEMRGPIAQLDADNPTASLEWTRLRSCRTYAKALRWLREHLEPIPDESVYFTPQGTE